MENIVGTSFQKEVWQEIKKIPKGETRTYKDIAIAIKKPNSSRAVANACGKNPLLITIPCHRVIRSDGNLGGYSGKGGIQKKLKLLIEESTYVASEKTKKIDKRSIDLGKLIIHPSVPIPKDILLF